jgi:hypothetical protein
MLALALTTCILGGRLPTGVLAFSRKVKHVSA